MECGEKISSLRKAKGMTQSDLGDALNVTYQAVSKWERGESLPDFDTICKLAKLFQVPLDYFGNDDGAEQAGQAEQAVTVAAPPAEDEKTVAMIGVCTVCGRVLHEGENAEGSAKLLCKPCAETERRKKAELERKQRQAQEAEQSRIEAQKLIVRDKFRNRTIWASVVAAPMALLLLIAGIILLVEGDPLFTDMAGDSPVFGVILMIASVLMIPSWIFQLFWDGAVRAVTCWGFFAVKLPGIIFTADLDGLIFLVVMKVLLTVLSWLISLFAIIFTSILAMLVGLFTFIPTCFKIHRQDENIL